MVTGLAAIIEYSNAYALRVLLSNVPPWLWLVHTGHIRLVCTQRNKLGKRRRYEGEYCCIRAGSFSGSVDRFAVLFVIWHDGTCGCESRCMKTSPIDELLTCKTISDNIICLHLHHLCKAMQFCHRLNVCYFIVSLGLSLLPLPPEQNNRETLAGVNLLRIACSLSSNSLLVAHAWRKKTLTWQLMIQIFLLASCWKIIEKHHKCHNLTQRQFWQQYGRL